MTGHFSGVNYSEFATYDRTTSALLVLRAHFLYDVIIFGSNNQTLVTPDGQVIPPGSNGGGGTVQCDIVSDFFDGGGGALWKPVSESTGNPVILLPASYWTSTQSIEVFGADGQFIVNGTFRTCCPNDNRAHFDIPRRASQLAANDPIIVRFNLKNGTKECRVVEDATQRND